MNKSILRRFQRQPDPDYAAQLYNRLTHIPAQPGTSPQSTHARLSPRLAIGLASLFLLAILVITVPGIRARFEDTIKQIGGLTILMTENRHEVAPDARVIPNDTLSLAEARLRLDRDFGLPTWLPDGLTMMEDNVVVTNDITNLTIFWVDEAVRGRGVSLKVNKAMPDVQLVIGPDAATEVMVHDIAATLIRGNWYHGREEWVDDGSRILRWQMGGIEYQLGTGNVDHGGVTDEELIQIAESIPVPE